MDPKPLIIRPGRQAGEAVATALGDPSITLIEGGPALGVLVAEGCHEDSYSGRLFLDLVTWLRGDQSVRTLRDYASVCICRDESGVWVAEEARTGRLFPRPSRVPYRVVFIPEREYRDLIGHKSQGNTEAIFDY
ncbi:MAG: hypothetical protein ABSG53_06500, partial [Thermoguttaceae bacterium]